MNRLQELIAELCPDGVEYKRVDQVVTIRNGSDHKHLDDGDIPVYGSGGVMRYVDTASYEGPSVLLPRKGSVDKVYFVDEPFWNVDTIFHTVIDETQVDPKFFYYLMVNAHLEQYSTSAARPSLTQRVLNKIVIPVPPIEVQREVVRILDEYTAAHDELIRQLEEEMALREQQLSIARNELLTCGDEVPWTKLDDLVLMKAGKHLSATEISNVQDEAHPYPCYGGNGLRGYTRMFNQSGKVVLVGRQGALCGNVKLASGQFYATEHAVVCSPVAEFSAEWLYHLLTHMDLNQYKTKSAQPGLSVSNIQYLPVQIPNLKEQERIAQVLVTIGEAFSSLLVELERDLLIQNEQLALVRNQLLSFPEKVA